MTTHSLPLTPGTDVNAGRWLMHDRSGSVKGPNPTLVPLDRAPRLCIGRSVLATPYECMVEESRRRRVHHSVRTWSMLDAKPHPSPGWVAHQRRATP